MSELLIVSRRTLSESLTFKKSLIRGDTIVSPYKIHEVIRGEAGEEGREREEGEGEEGEGERGRERPGRRGGRERRGREGEEGVMYSTCICFFILFLGCCYP